MLGLIMKPTRGKLPTTRESVTHKVTISGEKGPVEFYIVVGQYPDGRPGEIFVYEGLTEEPFADQWARAASILLQTGYEVDDLVRWFAYTKFQPAGYTDNPDLRMAHSVVDYVVRWMERVFTKPVGDTTTELGAEKQTGGN